MDNSSSCFVLLNHSCKSWFCPECKKSRALALREVLRTKFNLFSVPKLLTFTVDPSRFESGESAYRFVRDGRFIPRMLRYLGIKNWFCVLEFQRNGFPHWHLLVDLSLQPTRYVRRSGGVLDVKDEFCLGYFEIRYFLDLTRIHRLWRKWGIGEQIDLQTKKVRVSPGHAVNYIIKYLLKNPACGYPVWVLNSSNIRLISASRSLGALMNPGFVSSGIPDSGDDSGDDFEDDLDIKPVRSTIERVGMCGLQTKVLRIVNGVVTGGVLFDLPFKIVCKVFSSRLNDFWFRLRSGVVCKMRSCSSDFLHLLGDLSFDSRNSDLIFKVFRQRCLSFGVSIVEPAF